MREDLYHFQKAGLSLLQKDYEDFKTHLQKADTSFYAISKEAAGLNSYAKTLREHRPKSPALAGVMSAVLPGSGKLVCREKRTGYYHFYDGYRVWTGDL
ncbi:MAG: hypothetical protein U5L09_10885 [Bacteroidales bacterium]|nr:hypothetical protein [Bacteroidales bacterium]